MDRTRKPTTAGILCIILGVIFLTIASLMVSYFAGFYVVMAGFPPMLLVLGAFVIVAGIVPIVGGIYALRRRRWGLALAGSIFTLLDWVILGICGIVFFCIFFFALSDDPGANVEQSVFWALVIGSIVGLAIFAILGLLAVILVTLGRREFK